MSEALGQKHFFAIAKNALLSLVDDEIDIDELLQGDVCREGDPLFETVIDKKNEANKKILEALKQISSINCSHSKNDMEPCREINIDNFSNTHESKFIRTSITDYNNIQCRDKSSMHTETNFETGIREIIDDLSSSTTNKLISNFLYLITRRVDVTDLLPATQDVKANEEIMSMNSKVAMTINERSMIAAKAYVELISLPGAWAAGLIDVGIISALSALVRRWSVECRGREAHLLYEISSKRKHVMTTNSNVRRKKQKYNRLSKENDENNYSYQSDSQFDYEYNSIHKSSNSTQSLPYSDSSSNKNNDSAETEIIIAGLELAISLSKPANIAEFKSWSAYAQEFYIDAIVVALGTTTALSVTYNQVSQKTNNNVLSSYNLCLKAIQMLKISIKNCTLDKHSDLKVKLQGVNYRSKENCNTSHSLTKKSDLGNESHETSIFTIRSMFPLLTFQMDLPNGLKGKEAVYGEVTMLIKDVIGILSKKVDLDMENAKKSPRITPRRKLKTPSSKPLRESARENSLQERTPLTSHKRMRESVDRSQMVPPSLKKYISPKGSQMNSPNLQLSRLGRTRIQTNKFKIKLRVFIGMIQKMSTHSSLDRAKVRAKTASLLKTYIELLPKVEKCQIIKFFISLCSSKVSCHRLFAVEVIGVFIFSSHWLWKDFFNSNSLITEHTSSLISPDASCATLEHKREGASIAEELIKALCDRIADRSPAVRTRASFSLSQALKKLNHKHTCSLNQNEEYSKCFDEQKKSIEYYFSKSGQYVIDVLKKRIILDDKATVRRAAISAWTQILLLDSSSAHNLNQDDLSIICKHCNDPSVATRKEAADALSVILKLSYGKEYCSKYSFKIESAWTSYVLPLSLDSECTCKAKATDLLRSVILDPLIECGGKEPNWESSFCKNRYDAAWRLLSMVNDCPSETISTRENMKALTVSLEKILSKTGLSDESISVHLFYEVYSSITKSYDLEMNDDSVFPFNENSETDHRCIGAWCLLEALSDCSRNLDNLSNGISHKAVQSKALYLNDIIASTSMDLSFLSKSWKKLLILCNNFNVSDAARKRWILNARSCLRVMTQLAHQMPMLETKEMVSSLKQLLLSFSLSSDLVSPAISALLAMMYRLYFDTTFENFREICASWLKDSFDRCESFLSQMMSDLSPTHESIVTMGRVIFLVGELSLVGFATDENFSSVTSEPKLRKKKNISNTDPYRGLFVKPSLRLINYIEVCTLPRIPQLTGLGKNNTPSSVRAHAFVSLGKLCLRDEALARKNLNILVREVHYKLGESVPSVQSNVLLVLGDLCVKYTNLVDKFIPVIALCLQAGAKYDTNRFATDEGQDDNDKSFAIVRMNAIILLSNLLLQDYIKWKGYLLQRFLVSVVDKNERVSRLSEATLCGPLLSKYPNLFYNNFVSTIFILNGCNAHPIYSIFEMCGGSGESALAIIKEIDFSGQNKVEKRSSIYNMMLFFMTDEEKIGITARIVKGILGAAVNSSGDLHVACNLTTVGVENGVLSRRRFVNALNVLIDSFSILTSSALRIGKDRNSSDITYNEDIDPLGNGVGPNRAQINAVKGKLLSKISRKQLIETVVPILCNLKVKLEKNRSPLLKHLMQYLVSIFRQFKSEVKESLAGDPTLLQEIEYDTRKFERDLMNKSSLIEDNDVDSTLDVVV